MKRVFLVIVLVCVATSLSAQSRRSVLIRAAQPYDALVRRLNRRVEPSRIDSSM